MIIVAGCECKLCGDKIYSRANHDFKECFCGNVFIDGGPHIVEPKTGNSSHMRIGAKLLNEYEIVNIRIEEITALDLYKAAKTLFDDWNKQKNKFGCITNDSFTIEEKRAAQAKVSLV